MLITLTKLISIVTMLAPAHADHSGDHQRCHLFVSAGAQSGDVVLLDDGNGTLSGKVGSFVATVDTYSRDPSSTSPYPFIDWMELKDTQSGIASRIRVDIYNDKITSSGFFLDLGTRGLCRLACLGN